MYEYSELLVASSVPQTRPSLKEEDVAVWDIQWETRQTVDSGIVGGPATPISALFSSLSWTPFPDDVARMMRYLHEKFRVSRVRWQVATDAASIYPESPLQQQQQRHMDDDDDDDSYTPFLRSSPSGINLQFDVADHSFSLEGNSFPLVRQIVRHIMGKYRWMVGSSLPSSMAVHPQERNRWHRYVHREQRRSRSPDAPPTTTYTINLPWDAGPAFSAESMVSLEKSIFQPPGASRWCVANGTRAGVWALRTPTEWSHLLLQGSPWVNSSQRLTVAASARVSRSSKVSGDATQHAHRNRRRGYWMETALTSSPSSTRRSRVRLSTGFFWSTSLDTSPTTSRTTTRRNTTTTTNHDQALESSASSWSWEELLFDQYARSSTSRRNARLVPHCFGTSSHHNQRVRAAAANNMALATDNAGDNPTTDNDSRVLENDSATTTKAMRAKTHRTPVRASPALQLRILVRQGANDTLSRKDVDQPLTIDEPGSPSGGYLEWTIDKPQQLSDLRWSRRERIASRRVDSGLMEEGSALGEWHLSSHLQRPRGPTNEGRLLISVQHQQPPPQFLDAGDSSLSLSCHVEVEQALPAVLEPQWRTLVAHVYTPNPDHALSRTAPFERVSQTIIPHIHWTGADFSDDNEEEGFLLVRASATLNIKQSTTAAAATRRFVLSMDYQPSFINFELFPGDPNRGIELPAATAAVKCRGHVPTTGQHPFVLNSTTTSFTLHSNALLFMPPVPDMSMPYNVLSLTCSFVVFCIGSLLNSLVRRGSERIRYQRYPDQRPAKLVDRLKLWWNNKKRRFQKLSESSTEQHNQGTSEKGAPAATANKQKVE